MKHLCPVCAYSELPRGAQYELICPCCGTHFGYHDYAMTHQELRGKWIASGAHWFSQAQPPPLNWDPFVQLSEAGFILFRNAPLDSESRTNAQVSARRFFNAPTLQTSLAQAA